MCIYVGCLLDLFLFFLKYVETKEVLKTYFGDIIQELNNEHPNMNFELKLPDTKHRNNNGMSYIPQSRIAQRLNSELEKTTDNSSNMTTIACNHIIVAFKRIFNKYVDLNHATFMINISSQNRKVLTQLLDSEYYYYNCDHENYNYSVTYQMNKKQRSSLSISFHKLLNRSSNGNINVRNQDVTKRKSLINAQFEEFNLSMSNKIDTYTVAIAGDGDNKQLVNVNKQIYKWVLRKLILATEPSVHEISQLMNDSFIRFKMNKRDLFVQLCQKINH